MASPANPSRDRQGAISSAVQPVRLRVVQSELGLRPCDVVLLRAPPPGPEGTPSGLRSEPRASASGFAVAPNLAIMVLAPVPGALQLLDLAPDQLALERADVGDVQ